MRERITKLAIAFIAATLALAAAANARDVGDVMRTKDPAVYLPSIGCINWNDAYEMLRKWAAQGHRYAANSASQLRDLAGGRACMIFNDPSVEWRIVSKHRTQYTGSYDAWFCLELVELAKPTELAKPKPCFWVLLPDL